MPWATVGGRGSVDGDTSDRLNTRHPAAGSPSSSRSGPDAAQHRPGPKRLGEAGPPTATVRQSSDNIRLQYQQQTASAPCGLVQYNPFLRPSRPPAAPGAGHLGGYVYPHGTRQRRGLPASPARLKPSGCGRAAVRVHCRPPAPCRLAVRPPQPALALITAGEMLRRFRSASYWAPRLACSARYSSSDWRCAAAAVTPDGGPQSVLQSCRS